MSKGNEPAFPFLDIDSDGESQTWYGLTIRDYFAAKAMQGFTANGDQTEMYYRQISEAAYQLADAMLEEREK